MSEDKVAASRRDFLKFATVAAPAAAVAVAAGTATAEAAVVEDAGGDLGREARLADLVALVERIQLLGRELGVHDDEGAHHERMSVLE